MDRTRDPDQWEALAMQALAEVWDNDADAIWDDD